MKLLIEILLKMKEVEKREIPLISSDNTRQKVFPRIPIGKILVKKKKYFQLPWALGK